MCGLAGIVSLAGAPLAPTALKAMCDIQAHRGPDDAGYAFFRPGNRPGGGGGVYARFTDPEFHLRNQHMAAFGSAYFQEQCGRWPFLLGLGHRRLAVIDLSVAGHQPLAGSDRRFWLTFNGEIYNFPRLREELRSLGHEFHSSGDTEVILRLWEEYGLESLARLDGMFALAVYDFQENVLTLARDRFGVKPLYYAEGGDFFLYASEIKGLLASGLLKPEIDTAALHEYFTFQNIFSDRTLFKSVRLLEPGSYLYVKPGRGEAASRGWFHRRFPEVDPGLTDEKRLTREVAEVFGEAVRSQLISDVEVGAFLSGGMDSGSIVAVAGRRLPRLTTFTCGFDMTNVDGIEQGFDERSNSEALAYLLQTEHYAVVLHSGDMPAAMEKITWHVDDLRVGMCHQNWYAAKLAGKFVKVCLSGAGGDELFAGYPWRYGHCLADGRQGRDLDAYYAFWQRLLPESELAGGLFSPDLAIEAGGPRASFEAALAEGPSDVPGLNPLENLLQRILHFEFKTFLHGVLLIEDKISMAHSLEVRVPFLDNALVDLAFRLPMALKLNLGKMNRHAGGENFRADEGKLILRRAMREFLPERFTSQPKQGFSPPDGTWFRGESMDYIREVLGGARARQRPWFNQKKVDQCLNEHFQGRRNHRLLIWSLLSFEWLQRHYCETVLKAGPGNAR